MSCFGGLSPVLSNIGHVLRLHCGTIVCAPGVSGQDVVDQSLLAGNASMQDTSVDPSLAPLKGGLLLFVVRSVQPVTHCSCCEHYSMFWRQCFASLHTSPCLVLHCLAFAVAFAFAFGFAFGFASAERSRRGIRLHQTLLQITTQFSTHEIYQKIMIIVVSLCT